MNITLDSQDGATLVRLHEERLDAHISQEFKDCLLRALEGSARAVVVDLSDVHFVDSSGLGALLAGHKNAGLRNGRFALSGVQERVQAMFELTRLHRVFDLYPTAADALHSGAGGTPHEPEPH
ncbi:MAG: STAS domain-containing protein [Candidatus Methylumidiphilus sp.]